MKTLLICIFLLATSLLIRAWDNGGHMLTARIAFDRLDAETQGKLREKLRGLRVGRRDLSNPTMAATYMDVVRSATRRDDFPGMFQNWHFVKLEFTADGGMLPMGDPDADGKADVLRGWHHWKNRFQAGQRVTETYLGETLRVGPREALAMLIHLTGDAHQPLHTTSHAKPNGSDDQGGNGVEITNMGGDPLHSFWDSAYRRTTRAGRGGQLTVGEDAGLKVPAGAGVENAALGGIARKIIEASGLTKEELDQAAGQLDPATWVRESHEDGFTNGYNALGNQLGKAKVKLDAAYVDTARKVASVRIAKAGARLAAILKELLQ